MGSGLSHVSLNLREGLKMVNSGGPSTHFQPRRMGEPQFQESTNRQIFPLAFPLEKWSSLYEYEYEYDQVVKHIPRFQT